MTYFLQQVVNASIVSSFYGLLAVAYVLMHGITGRVNLAFGALAIWSGMLLISFALTFMAVMPGAILLPLLLAGAIALINTTALGFAVERIAVRPLLDVALRAMLVTTLAVAIVLEETMRLMNSSRELWLMPVFNAPLIGLATHGIDVQMSAMQLFVAGTALFLALALMVIIARHPFGRAWRAVSQDLTMASLCGVDPGRTLAVTFMIATALAAIAGILFALHYGSVSFYGGLIIGLKTLFVAVVGGLNSVRGGFFGGLLLGFLETFWSAYGPGEYRDAAVLAALIGLLIAFPSGLFPDGQESRAP